MPVYEPIHWQKLQEAEQNAEKQPLSTRVSGEYIKQEVVDMNLAALRN